MGSRPKDSHGWKDRSCSYPSPRRLISSCGPESTRVALEEGYFGKKREIDYSDALDQHFKTVPVAELQEPDEPCGICGNEYTNGSAHAPLEYQCMHIFCRSCIAEICKANTPLTACCPYCRRAFFKDASTLDQLVYNVFNGVFYDRNDLNEAENFQLSCADLDRELATSHEPGTRGFRHPCDNPAMVWDIWYNIAVMDAEMDHRNYRSVLFPEFKTLMQAVDWTLRNLPLREEHEFHLSLGKLYKLLEGGIHFHFIHHARVGGRAAYYWPPSLDAQVIAPDRNTAARNGVYRPGHFQEFIERSLHRTLQFLRLRQCACQASKPEYTLKYADYIEELWAKRRHWHGDRQYYNPDTYRELEDVLALGEGNWNPLSFYLKPAIFSPKTRTKSDRPRRSSGRLQKTSSNRRSV